MGETLAQLTVAALEAPPRPTARRLNADCRDDSPPKQGGRVAPLRVQGCASLTLFRRAALVAPDPCTVRSWTPHPISILRRRSFEPAVPTSLALRSVGSTHGILWS
jgi:hypothetical protein